MISSRFGEPFGSSFVRFSGFFRSVIFNIILDRFRGEGGGGGDVLLSFFEVLEIMKN